MFDHVIPKTATTSDQSDDQGLNSAIITLVLKAQKGDETAFEELYNSFVSDIYRYTASRIPEEHASDLVSEVFFRIWKKLHTFQGHADGQFRAWMFTIAHHRVIDFYRSNKQVLPIEEGMEFEDQDDMNDPRHAYGVEKDFARTQKALQKLPEKQQEALVLSYLNDMTHQEIAEIMKEREGNVRILIHRGLKRLRELLDSKNS